MRLPAVYAPTYPAPTARRSPQTLADLSATSAPVPHAIEQVATDPAKQARAACDFPVRLTRWRGERDSNPRRAGLSHRAREVAGGTESSQTPRWS
jgi:hypothetical protein